MGAVYSKSNILRRFLLSYIAVLIIPIFLSTWVFTSWLKSTEDNLIDRSISNLEQIRRAMDGRIREIDSVNRILGETAYVTRLYDLGKDLKGSPDMFKVYQASQYMLSEAFLYSSMIDDIFIFYKNSDIVVNKYYTSIDNDYFYGNTFSYSDLNLDEYKDLIFDHFYDMHVMPPVTLELERGISEVVPMIQSIPDRYPYKPKAVILTILNKDEFDIMLSELNIGSGFAGIHNEYGELVAGSGLSSIEIGDDKISIGESGYFREKIKGKNMIITYVSSPENGWLYMAGYLVSEVTHQTRYVKYTIGAMLFISLLFGGLAAYIFARRNAGPISHVVDLLRLNNGKRQTTGT